MIYYLKDDSAHKSDDKIDIKKLINKELKEYKDLFKQFCLNSDLIIQESLNNKDLLKNEINLKVEEWIDTIKSNQNKLLDKAEDLHSNFSDSINILLKEQMSRQLKSKNLKHMDQNELSEFRLEVKRFKEELNFKIERLNGMDSEHEIKLIDENLITKKKNLTNNNLIFYENSIKDKLVKENLLSNKAQLIESHETVNLVFNSSFMLDNF